MWNRLTTLSQPLLVVAGARDEKFVALARRMAELAPHARLEIIADAGHSAHLEQPTTLAGAFAHWITSPRT
jgi:2-succinyl-6-hydroxy-2,4-cyclohexadiene-1-carboxylate synthase